MAAPEPEIRRQRVRSRFRRVDEETRSDIVERVLRFYHHDMEAVSGERDRRLQLYAKYRQWTTGKNFPFANSSDAAIPDLTTASQRTQDFLVNAFLSARPPMAAKARRKDDMNRQRIVDSLQDYQFMVEQPGEDIVAEAAECFANDPSCVVFVHWVREKRRAVDTRVTEPLAPDENPRSRFLDMLEKEYPDLRVRQTDEEGWDWEHLDDRNERDAQISFYTDPDTDEVEMLILREVAVYDGPRVVVKDYEDVLAPVRAANLQPPSPSNPGGASHVILRDFNITIEEIQRLQRAGFYDLLDDETMDSLVGRGHSTGDEAEQEQTDVLAGKHDEPPPHVEAHRYVTRLLVFDTYDFDGDGVPEDMVFWVLVEPRLLIKAMPLTEFFPADKPMRPLAESQYLPVQGRRSGISILEVLEGIHDVRKEIVDLMVDAGKVSSFPFGFYRPTSSLKPENIQISMMELYPLQDPSRDVNFPQLPTQNQGFAFNFLSAIQPMEEKLTAIGDLSAGRVPPGQSSALRTSENLQLLLSQAEARPERILRRFFRLWSQVFQLIHQANKRFLPKRKQFRIAGVVEPGEDPFQDVNREDLDTTFDFEFRANVQNATRQSRLFSLMDLSRLYISPLAIQFGITQPEGAFRLLRDIGQATGMDPDRYIQPPTADALLPKIQAEEAIAQILDGRIPQGIPAEGAQMHLAKLEQFAQDDRFGLLEEQGIELFQGWVATVQERAQAEAQLQAAAASAEQTQREMAQGGPGGGNGPTAAPQQPPISGSNELLDESLPGAGGGANTGATQ